MKQVDILVPGHYFCDIIFSGLPHFPAMGTEIYTRDLTVVPGGVMNTVVGMHRLGVKVGWLGLSGNDFFSKFALDRAQQEGLDISLLAHQDASLQRVTVSLSEPHDRAFVSFIDPAPDVVSMVLDVRGKVEYKHLHFTGLVTDERLPALLHECRAKNIVVSMDCQHRPETLDMPIVQEVLSLVDMFMPNAGEAMRLTGKTDLNDAATDLLNYVPLLIVKDGANGAHAFRKGEYYHAPALPNITPIDTTGAGDVFNAGFLAAHTNCENIETCLRWGNISGGLSTQGWGGCSTAPTLAELKNVLAKNQ